MSINLLEIPADVSRCSFIKKSDKFMFQLIFKNLKRDLSDENRNVFIKSLLSIRDCAK